MTVRGLVLLALAAAVLAGCGSDAGDGPAADQGLDGAAPFSADLEIVAGVVDDPTARGRAELSCGPDGAVGTGWLSGDAATRACELLVDESARSQLPPPPADQMCAEVYGGPDVATVVGTVAGEAVDASLDRHDACAIARWDALVPLVPEPGGA